MFGLVSTYKDIFDGYLLIRDHSIANRDSERLQSKLVVLPGFVLNKIGADPIDGTEKQNSEIIYHSGDLAMNYVVNVDSLVKKSDGFSLLDLRDITIEGDPYKLFLYPFEIGAQRLILAGLISQSNYRQANQKIPFSFFSLFAVLLLLLVIHLPILKIYILGPSERIRDTDIRLVIGSYFIAAFFGFFLFTKIFLDWEQLVQNKKHLEILSDKIVSNLYQELDTIKRQLSCFDDTLSDLCKKKADPILMALTRDTSASIAPSLDEKFNPRSYPYIDNVFWIDNNGQWVARWAFKYVLAKSPMLKVKDRQYFKDFKSGKALLIPGIEDSLTILPTLSKLEGEYTVNVIKRSCVKPYLLHIQDSVFNINPMLIGLSSEMHSLTRVLLPPGYGFSIIDDQGNTMYDSKPGRSLLSNILKDIEDPTAIQQSALYRNKRYFSSLMVNGKSMALLSMPISGMPNQLLVYYNLYRSDGFEEHLVGLSAGLVGSLLGLLIFSALINQWTKPKTRLLKSRSQNFEWLHPSAQPLKQMYYRHLINWMLALFLIYLLSWCVVEAWLPRSEFSLLYISLLFPFYIALHYYELRERYYDVSENRTGISWYFSRPSPLLRGLLLIIIVLINCFTSIGNYSASVALPVEITQLVWAAFIAGSTFLFRRHMISFNLSDVRYTAFSENPELKFKDETLRPYIWCILTGVILISIIPASGIFWLLFRQETGLYLNADQLISARQIDQRRQSINQHIQEYKFNIRDSQQLSFIRDLKFTHGIYLISGKASVVDTQTVYSPLFYPSAEYIQLHKQFFPSDSLILAWIAPTDSAADGSWYFAKDSMGKDPGPELVYRNRGDITNPNEFRLTADSSAAWSTAGLMVHSFSGGGTMFPILYIVSLCFSLVIAYFLTLSLTRRVFLLDLLKVSRKINDDQLEADKYYEQNGIGLIIKLLIYETYQQSQFCPIAPGQSGNPFLERGFPSLKDIYFFEKNMPMRDLENKMSFLVKTLEPVYSNLWKVLSGHQKFLLYDFCQDGFANYKAEKDLLGLIERGLLFFDDMRLTAITLSFQEYVLQMNEDPDIKVFMATARQNIWKKFKSPVLIVVAAVGIFIFATQEEVYQKITGILTSLTSLLPLLTGLFNKDSLRANSTNLS